VPHDGKNAFASAACPNEPPRRSYLYKSAWELRYRSAISGGVGIHDDPPHNPRFHNACHEQAGKVAYDLDRMGRLYAPDDRDWSLRWVGDAGVQVCKVGWHRYGLAIDLTRFHFGTSRVAEMVRDWHDSLARRRRYLAVLAICRKHFGRVLHAHNDTDGSHWNHIHVDLGRHAVPLNPNFPDDAIIIQWAARELAGYDNMVLDGTWGQQTQNGYERLIKRFKLQVQHGGCYNLRPKQSTADCRILMEYIARNGFSNRGSYYTAPTPPCPPQ
jgi:hypothetical protein